MEGVGGTRGCASAHQHRAVHCGMGAQESTPLLSVRVFNVPNADRGVVFTCACACTRVRVGACRVHMTEHDGMLGPAPPAPGAGGCTREERKERILV